MDVRLPYFDASYLVRLYLQDYGFEQVRELAASASAVACAWHAQAEVVAALHRAFRESRLPQEVYRSALDQFIHDSKDGLVHWLPLTDLVQRRLERFFRKAGATTFLRAADALHLACAAQHGYTEVFSHDRHFLAAAPLFGLKGINVISALSSS